MRSLLAPAREGRAVRGLALALAVTAGCDAPQTAPPSPGAAQVEAPATVSAPPPGALGPIESSATVGGASAPHGVEVGGPPPASERLFTFSPPQGSAWLLGARGRALWAAELDASSGAPTVRWVSEGEGSAQLVAAGDEGGGFALWVARGRSRDARTAPIALQRLDAASGAAREVFRIETPRNDPAALSVSDVDGDGRSDLAFAYFGTQHVVRARDALATGTVREGDVGHTAATRFFADVDGDARADEIVGQIYDADPEVAGKLRVRVKGAWVEVPTSGGIRTALPMRVGDRDALLVSDGWHKNYGKEARARLSLATWKGAAFVTEALGASARDTSFLQLGAAEAAAGPLVLAQGDVTAHLFSRAGGPWASREVVELAGSLSAVIVKLGGGAVVAYDARRPAAPVTLAAAP